MAFAHKTKHQCHLCAYSSSVKAELKKHVVANHENGVKCTIEGCNITIAYNRLKRHVREVHCRDTKVGHTVEAEQLGEMRSLSCGGTSTDECASMAGSHEDPLISNVELQNGSVLDDMANLSCAKKDDASAAMPPQELPDCDFASTDDKTGSSSACSASTSGLVPSCVATCPRVSDCVSEGSFDSERGAEDFSDEDSVMQRTSNEPETKQYVRDDGIRQGDFVCAVCCKRFRSLRDEKRHNRRVHERSYKQPERQRRYRCTERGCERTFSLPAKLREHQAVHRGKAVISCDNCEKYFKSRACYAVHLRRYHQLSIRDVNCSPSFISVLEAEAGKRFDCSNEYSNCDKTSNGLVLSKDFAQTEEFV
ncbi:Putative zinc finger protein F56D1.1 [Toxocara canis]|uniref:Putative zinc finger protein F56D1.1 n=1 Tax=Toxocara canis TaxID=6265 RepID=A0A0B2V2T2_TOXCA|nr:Putative zinc finger protein F56D1.1 [Toxocara canis]